MPCRRLPTGTVTFLFTDIEGSTKLWEQHPDEMREALALHDQVLRDAVERNGGCVFKTFGDAFCAAFHTAPEAAAAAAQAQLGLKQVDGLSIRVRVAIHTGTAECRDNDYFGPTLNRVARLLATGHGGQVLLSDVSQGLCLDSLPAGVSLKALGEHRLKDLGRPESIFQLDHFDLSADFPPLKSLEGMPNNLPQQVTSFVGREREIEEIKSLLGHTRLLTITGSGGCGKTRLSLQVAADLLDSSGDGVWFVELAGLSDPLLVPQTIATVFGLKEQPGNPITDNLADYLRPKRLLLILDNCEHLLDACAAIAEHLLRACPHLVLLASSREAMSISGEQTYRVPSLSLPEPGHAETPLSLTHYEAVRLFIDRALLHRIDFAVTNENAPALASVCYHLDGIPLAIELAAVRIRSMSLEEINERLDQRFRLLTGGSRTALPRQQTLRSLIDWSYDLLSEAEKELLRRLSVFAGGWTMEAAEKVCSDDSAASDVLDLLPSLVSKSLVTTEERNGATRYRLLETVRQYANGLLAESGGQNLLRDRHLDYFAELAEISEPKLFLADQVMWLKRLAIEFDNFRAAIDWARDGDGSIEQAIRLAAALGHFWGVRGGFSEGRNWIATLLDAAPDLSPVARSRALQTAGLLAWHQGDYTPAKSGYEQALAIRRVQNDRLGVAASVLGKGNVAFRQADYPVTRTCYEESLALALEEHHSVSIGHALHSLGLLEWTLGDHAVAEARYEESLLIWRKIGNRIGISAALNNLGILAIERGDLSIARTLLEEAMKIRLELGDRAGLGFCYGNLGKIACQEGNYKTGQELFGKTLAIVSELGDRRGIAKTKCNLGFAAWRDGNLNEGKRLIVESLIGARELCDRQQIAYSLNYLGVVAFEERGYESGRKHVEESLRTLRDIGEQLATIEALEVMAPILSNLDQIERAARIWGAAERFREDLGAPQDESDVDRYQSQLAAARAAFGNGTQFEAEWAEGRELPMEQAISLALGESSS